MPPHGVSCSAVSAAARESRSASVRRSCSCSPLLFQASALASSFAVATSAWACQTDTVRQCDSIGSIRVLGVDVCNSQGSYATMSLS